MSAQFTEKILKELEKIPEDKLPKLYRFIHMLAIDIIFKAEKKGKRSSLKGIWKGSQIDESLFYEAKKTLFPYEYR